MKWTGSQKERDTGKHTEIRKRKKYRWGEKDKPIEKEIMKYVESERETDKERKIQINKDKNREMYKK